MSKTKWVNVTIVVVLAASVIGGLTYWKRRQEKLAKAKAAAATATTTTK